MVQRKVPNKLGIQADHVKSEKQLGNLKPSCYQNQDGKNRGVDLKKKMKKSRSFKYSDFERLLSPTLRRGVPQPRKPLKPLDVPATAATPQKQSPIKASYGSPNYMKSTSSFDARKELNQVSSQNFRTGTHSRSLSTNNYSDNSKHSSASSNKMGRTLTRISSSKLARTLTKSPSFKPVRGTVTKCSQVALCENLNVQRATCSSTLKDSKFPSYLTLHPGRTELEGTSVMKVCPYTYCSLNGHHHPPLPPLKCFLSARRRMLKTQKSMKLGCLSPCRVKPFSDRKKEIDTRKVAVDEKPAIQEPDLNSSAVNPLIQEESMDFFIEIYISSREDTADAIGKIKHNGDDQDTTDFSVNDITPSVSSSDESAGEHDDEVEENLSDEPLHSEIDYADNLDQNSNVISIEIAEFLPDVAKEVYPPLACTPSSPQQQGALKCLNNRCNLEVESHEESELNEPDVESSDMEWEEGLYSASYPDDEIDNSIQTNSISDLERVHSLETDNPSFHDEPIFNSDDIVSSCNDENPTNEVLQEFYDESVSFDSMFGDSDSESNRSYQSFENDESIKVFDNQIHGQLSPTHDASEELTIKEERDENVELVDWEGTANTMAPITDSTEKPVAAGDEKNGASDADNEIPRMDLPVGDDKIEHTKNIEDEAFTDHQDNEDLQDNDATALQGNQQSDPSHDFTGQDQDKTYKDYTTSHNITEVEQSDAAINNGRFSVEVFGESLLPTTEDSDTDPDFLEQEHPTADAGDGMDEDQVDAAKLLLQATFDLLQGFSEADQDTTMEDNDENQIDVIANDIKSNQTSADEGLSAETRDHSFDKQQRNRVVENQNQPEEDRDAAEKFQVKSSFNSQDHTHSGIDKFTLEENNNQDVIMGVKERTEPDAEETFPIAKNVAGTETKNVFLNARSNSNLELPKTCSNPIGAIRFKRSIQDCEEPRKFNPREPNYLPEVLDPEAEKVDLRHQIMDERKNSEEWMLDYAVQQAVSQLAPARKKKVALLVEAFETVMPIPKFETRLRHTSAAFAHARSIQACN